MAKRTPIHHAMARGAHHVDPVPIARGCLRCQRDSQTRRDPSGKTNSSLLTNGPSPPAVVRAMTLRVAGRRRGSWGCDARTKSGFALVFGPSTEGFRALPLNRDAGYPTPGVWDGSAHLPGTDYRFPRWEMRQEPGRPVPQVRWHCITGLIVDLRPVLRNVFDRDVAAGVDVPGRGREEDPGEPARAGSVDLAVDGTALVREIRRHRCDEPSGPCRVCRPHRPCGSWRPGR